MSNTSPIPRTCCLCCYWDSFPHCFYPLSISLYRQSSSYSTFVKFPSLCLSSSSLWRIIYLKLLYIFQRIHLLFFTQVPRDFFSVPIPSPYKVWTVPSPKGISSYYYRKTLPSILELRPCVLGTQCHPIPWMSINPSVSLCDLRKSRSNLEVFN